jgi:hypothetical protein
VSALDDKQYALYDAIEIAKELLSALKSAESCVTMIDFRANVDEAKAHIRRILSTLEES